MKIDMSSDGSKVTIYTSPNELRDMAKRLELTGLDSQYVEDATIDAQVELNFATEDD